MRAIVGLVIVLMLTKSSSGSRPPPLCLAGVYKKLWFMLVGYEPEVASFVKSVMYLSILWTTLEPWVPVSILVMFSGYVSLGNIMALRRYVS